ncbi:major facilitator superfamily MFS_1 [Catenulispora acidiphila DSM 44928]|uniref:Major facilitator superfamily MFS_1 n=1 Tax=Catenulispora acidiphila (strain DSM 44928 / JCM 14897 / NBRC 102108 / NRRL B-24433 / ID139908) TaxID=479433 RepID=C7PY18_CATAD|nr:MFS transporter [Catenulispora acidiphila]ACU73478.1 major facilitator superfamily MFS_1 [Catenulispora acidiphila DSM 44928]
MTAPSPESDAVGAPGAVGVRRLMLGRTAAALATSLIPTTLTLAVVHAGSAAGALGVILACEFVPMLLLLPVAGVFADRFPARRVILAADLTRAAAQAGIGATLLAGGVNVAALSALAALTGGAVAFGTPAVRTLVSATVCGPQRQRLNARLSVWQQLAQFAGPGVAGSLMLGIGAGWSSLLTAALFTGSALTLGGLPTPARHSATVTATATATALATDNADADTYADGNNATDSRDTVRRAPFLQELRAGWTETRRHSWFIANVLGHGIWNMTAGLLLTLGPVIAVNHLGGGTAWVITLQSGTAGMLAGVWTAGRLHLQRPLIAVALGASAYALPLAALAATAPLPLLLAAYTAGMFGLGILDPLWETTVQQRIPRHALGRVGSFDSLISFAARPAGLALAAPIATAVGTALPLAVAAVLVGGANLAVLLLPAVREHPKAAQAVPAPLVSAGAAT